MFFVVLAVYAVILIAGFLTIILRKNEWQDVALIAYILAGATYIAQDILKRL